MPQNGQDFFKKIFFASRKVFFYGLVIVFNAMKKFYVIHCLLTVVGFLAINSFALGSQEAGAPDQEYQAAIHLLGSKSRNDIKSGIAKLASLNNLKVYCLENLQRDCLFAIFTHPHLLV